MRVRALAALCLTLLLAGCAAAPQAEPPVRLAAALPTPAFPAEYALTFRLDAYQGEERTSSHRFTAIRTETGFYCADSTGVCYLFLRQPSGLYRLYIRHPVSGELAANGEVLLTRAGAERLQDLLCGLGILVRNTAGLTETSQAKVRGRPCHILQSQETAAGQTVCRRIYCIDGETGLALQQSIHYGGTGGTILSYILTCEEFRTSGVTLPEVAGAP